MRVSAKERRDQVRRLMAEGKSRKEMAGIMGVCLKQVHTYIRQIDGRETYSEAKYNPDGNMRFVRDNLDMRYSDIAVALGVSDATAIRYRRLVKIERGECKPPRSANSTKPRGDGIVLEEKRHYERAMRAHKLFLEARA